MARERATPAWEIAEADGTVATRSLTTAVVNLLRSSAAQRINFLFNAVIVSPARLTDVAYAIENFEIIVYYDPKFVHAPGPNDAYYSASQDAIYLGFNSLASISNRMVTLHECVHAISDINKSWGLSQLDDECAAYVASAMYHRYTGSRRPRVPANPNAVLQMYEAAFYLADCYIEMPNAVFDAADMLRKAVLNVSIYKGIDTHPMKYTGLEHRHRGFRMQAHIAMRYGPMQ